MAKRKKFAAGGLARSVADDSQTRNLDGVEKKNYKFMRNHWHGADKESREDAMNAATNPPGRLAPIMQGGDDDGGPDTRGDPYKRGGFVRKKSGGSVMGCHARGHGCERVS